MGIFSLTQELAIDLGTGIALKNINRFSFLMK